MDVSHPPSDLPEPMDDKGDAAVYRLGPRMAAACVSACILALFLSLLTGWDDREAAIAGEVLRLVGLGSSWASLLTGICLPVALFFSLVWGWNCRFLPASAGFSFLALLAAQWVEKWMYSGPGWASTAQFRMAAFQTLAVLGLIFLVRHIMLPWGRSLSRRRLGFDVFPGAKDRPRR